MNTTLQTGIENENEITVSEKTSAKNCASGEMDVYATPMMIALMEQTADESVRPYLDEGMATVGTLANVKHLSATPLGMKVTAKSKLIEIDRRRLVFEVKAFDEAGLIGEGLHERFIIEKEKFMQKTNSKKQSRCGYNVDRS